LLPHDVFILAGGKETPDCCRFLQLQMHFAYAGPRRGVYSGAVCLRSHDRTRDDNSGRDPCAASGDGELNPDGDGELNPDGDGELNPDDIFSVDAHDADGGSDFRAADPRCCRLADHAACGIQRCSHAAAAPFYQLRSAACCSV
jgi:hypothetical protein